MEPSRARTVRSRTPTGLCWPSQPSTAFVLAAQVALLLGTGDGRRAARLRGSDGWPPAKCPRDCIAGRRAHQITAAGLRAIDSALPAPRGFDLAGLPPRRRTGLAEAGGAAGTLRLGARRGVRTPDALARRARTRLRRGRFGVRLGGVGPGGRERLHYPDLVIVAESGHRVAFELELTTKEPDRRARILARLWRRSSHRRGRLSGGPPIGGPCRRALGAAPRPLRSGQRPAGDPRRRRAGIASGGARRRSRGHASPCTGGWPGEPGAPAQLRRASLRQPGAVRRGAGGAVSVGGGRSVGGRPGRDAGSSAHPWPRGSHRRSRSAAGHRPVRGARQRPARADGRPV